MTMSCKVVVAGLLVTLLLACSETTSDASSAGQNSSGEELRLVQWALPKELREVSGLAMVNDREVLAIQDERAIVFLLDIQTGRVVERFAIGQPAAKGDFEGVAVHDEQIYLLTSKGQLYKAPLRSNDKFHRYEKFDLGLAKNCELEGLAHEPNTDLLWLACKEVYLSPDSGSLRLHAWSTATQALMPELAMKLPLSLDGQESKLNPSGLVFSRDGQRLLIIAARQSSYAWFSWSGIPSLVNLEPLPKRGKHRQAEGVAITSKGLLLIADEGKKRAGILSQYSGLLE